MTIVYLPHIFLLGGHDLEMLTIRELLHAHAPECFVDKGLSWGARASAYRGEIEAVLKAGLTPVLVELVDDIGIDWKGCNHRPPRPGWPGLTSPRHCIRCLIC